MKVPPFDLTKAPHELQTRLARRPDLNLYKLLPYAGVLAPLFMDMGAAIRTQLQLDPKLRELAIIRVGMLTGAEYEVHHHTRIGLQVGLSQEQIEALAQWREAAVFEPLQRLVLEYAGALTTEVKAPDALFEALRRDLGTERLAELTVAIGFYLLVTRFLVNFGVEVEQHG